MRKILILAVALATRGTFAALVMDDTKEFFDGGARLPGRVASCPSPSLRTAAVLPEIYGALSAWMERTFLYRITSEGLIHAIPPPEHLEDLKTADVGDYNAYWDEPYGQAMSNRIVTARLSWWPLADALAYAMKRGLPDVTYGGGISYGFGANSSTALGGQNFPTIDWTTNLIEAVPTNRWVGIWPDFGHCPTDGVWKTERGGRGIRHYDNEQLIADLYNGFFDVDYPDLYAAIRNWESPLSCLDMLRGKIDDEAFAMTNRTLRLDRRQIAAVENALGLCDTYIAPSMGRPDIGLEFCDLTYLTEKYSRDNVDADWRFNGNNNTIAITTDETPTFDDIVSRDETITNDFFTIGVAYAWCGGSAEHVSMSADLQGEISAPASNLYNYVTSIPNLPDEDTWTVTGQRFSIDGSHVTYLFRKDSGGDAELGVDLSGRSHLFVYSSATGSNRVRFAPYEVAFSSIGLPMPTFMMTYNFIDRIDVALGRSCTSYVGFVPWDSVSTENFPAGSLHEYALKQVQTLGRVDNWKDVVAGELIQMARHARGHVESAIGGNLDSRDEMLPISKTPAYRKTLVENYHQVASGGPAQLTLPIQKIYYDKERQIFAVEREQDIWDHYTSSSTDSVRLAHVQFTKALSLSNTNGLDHVEAAAAQVRLSTSPPLIRAVMRWRNCRFEDD